MEVMAVVEVMGVLHTEGRVVVRIEEPFFCRSTRGWLARGCVVVRVYIRYLGNLFQNHIFMESIATQTDPCLRQPLLHPISTIEYYNYSTI